MLSDARAEGLSPLVCSAYRDAEFQTILYNNQVETQMASGLTYTEAAEEARRLWHIGYKRHQLDCSRNVSSGYQLHDDGRLKPKRRNGSGKCHKYGFILHPPDKTNITG